MTGGGVMVGTIIGYLGVSVGESFTEPKCDDNASADIGGIDDGGRGGSAYEPYITVGSNPIGLPLGLPACGYNEGAC